MGEITLTYRPLHQHLESCKACKQGSLALVEALAKDDRAMSPGWVHKEWMRRWAASLCPVGREIEEGNRKLIDPESWS